MSSHKMIGLNHDLTKISNIEFWRGAPISRQSSREAEFFVGFEEALYAILSLVVSVDFLMKFYFANKPFCSQTSSTFSTMLSLI